MIHSSFSYPLFMLSLDIVDNPTLFIVTSWYFNFWCTSILYKYCSFNAGPDLLNGIFWWLCMWRKPPTPQLYAILNIFLCQVTHKYMLVTWLIMLHAALIQYFGHWYEFRLLNQLSYIILIQIFYDFACAVSPPPPSFMLFSIHFYVKLHTNRC